MSEIKRTIRLSQVTSTFGVGAVYDILGESLVLCDTWYWGQKSFKGKGRKIKATRLIKDLNASGVRVSELYEPAKKKRIFADSKKIVPSLPYMRFPRWLFCSKCRRMKKWTFADEREGGSPSCSHCKEHGKLTPMRFIMICDHGHMSDVPWDYWAHSKTEKDHQKSCRSEDLEFVTGFTKSGGLESVAVKCRKCEASRHLGRITSPKAMATIGVSCSGKQPWQKVESAVKCTRDAHVVQRGAGNVYYPRIRSAITIPPESHFVSEDDTDLATRLADNPFYKTLMSVKGNPGVEAVIIDKLCEQFGCSDDDIRKVMGGDISESSAAPGSVDIEAEEWDALTHEIAEQDDRDMFVTRHISLNDSSVPFSSELSDYISKIVSVVKLREVRVMTEYFRYQPGGSGDEGSTSQPVKLDGGKGEGWLPATEVFGEGVFLSLNEKQLQQWENHPAVLKRIETLEHRSLQSPFHSILPTATPRYVLLHTLAHILIRQLAFESGYSSASLRERIYCKENGQGKSRAGILIYTAAGDSEGTLGGLARQAEGQRLASTLLAALQDAAWCSADPICSESNGQGLDGMNLAACHACSLVAETSCTNLNLLLDRVLLTGDDQTPGFFNILLQSAMESSVIN